MNIVGIIPSRYESSRLPGKPLAMIANKPMVQWVYENCTKGLEHVFVATDDQRIIDAVEAFGGKAVMTDANHCSGTDRCAEAALRIKEKYNIPVDIVINIQGDEPFFETEQLIDVQKCFKNPEVKIATLIQEIKNEDQLFSQSEVKITLNSKSDALYFSRSPIPFIRNKPQNEWLKEHTFYRHLGIYAFRYDTLMEIVKLKPSSLEIAESLEQLRWLENGFSVNCAITELEETLCVDTKEDLIKANKIAQDLI